jgi:hypothetical protein
MKLGEERRTELIKRIGADPTLWRAEAWAAYGQVADELTRVQATGPPPGADKAFDRETEIVRDALDDVLEAMTRSARQERGEKESRPAYGASRLTTAISRYYSGADINRAWSAIHRASEALYSVYNPAELNAQVTRLKALVAALPDLQTQLATLSDAHAKLDGQEGESDARRKDAGARALFRELYRQAIGTTESLQAEARALRNTLLVSSCTLFVVLLLVGIVSLFDPNVFSLCTEAAKGENVCPTGSDAHRFDVFAVGLAGMLGGMLSVVIPLATGERIKTPYRVFNQQLLLKVLAGAATALTGMLLLDSGFISALEVKSEEMIVGYAVFFGFSQQVVTGFVDRRANELGKETPTTKTV